MTATVRRSLWKTNNWVDGFLFLVRVASIVFIAVGLLAFILQQARGEGLTGTQLENLFISGVTQGAMYGLIALGYSMVYGVLGFINFAHGEVFMAGAMAGWITSDVLFESGLWEDSFILAIIIVLVISIVVSTFATVVIERVAYRPLRESPRLIPLITSIGVSFFLQYAVSGLFGPASKNYPPLPEWLSKKRSLLGFVDIEGTKVLVILVSAVSMYALWWFVERTKTGKAMRAVAEDKEIAALMGINVNRIIVTTFGVGGAMAGVAGIMWGLLFRTVTFTTGFLPGIKAFTAAVVGGVGNLGGAMAGGLFLGVAESVGPLLLLEPLGVPGVSQLKDLVAFSVLVLVLLFKPTGLFGERLSQEDRA
ncbi:MAG: branched-chain amino acid ABC transporter permease [Actinomycetia bacterium]|nr:branched-chain amino acid ABC transporter permease [Actinomycetes bacterium]